jgi:hypothetical protein
MISLKMASEHCNPQHFVRHRKRIGFDGRRDLVAMTSAKATTNCADCVDHATSHGNFFYAQFLRGKAAAGLAVAWLPPAVALIALLIPAPY